MYDLLYLVVSAVCVLICGSSGVISLVKMVNDKKYHLEEKKFDDTTFKTRCKMLAIMLKNGVNVPVKFIIKVLEDKVSNETFAETITDLKQEKKEVNNYEKKNCRKN